MKAVVALGWGPPEVLHVTDVERPTPRKGEVRVRMMATSVTFSDCLVRGLKVARRYRVLARLLLGYRAPRRNIFGMVLAGEVESVGRDVKNFRPGDEVFGLSRWKVGCYAEYVCYSANGLIAAKPTNLGYDEAAALPYGGLLALHLLRSARIQAGQRVLVYGASGAIGTATVQLAKHFGATVTGVCSMRSLIGRIARRDAVVTTRARTSRREPSATTSFSTPWVDERARRRCSTPETRWRRAAHAFRSTIVGRSSMPRICWSSSASPSRELTPVIDRTYPLEEIVEAHRHVDEGHKRGNVIVTIGHHEPG
jgi:alcohol dehydrogenase